MIFSHLIALSLGREIRSRLPFCLFGNSPKRPRKVRALSTILLSIFRMITILLRNLLKVNSQGFDKVPGSMDP